jgi:CheY-like chemotaxis protein
MSDQDSDVTYTKSDSHLHGAGRELVHNVATPLATLQLNLQVLSTSLPLLLEHCRSVGLPQQIKPERLDSLGSLPEALCADIRKIRQAMQAFSAILVPNSADQAFNRESFRRNDNSATKPRVLLVEDEAIHQEIARKQLGDRYHLDIVSSEREALEMVASKKHGVVLLDLMLSGRDARSLIGELRSIGPTGLQIVLVSNMPLSAIDVQQLQVDGVLEKPFRLASLEALF